MANGNENGDMRDPLMGLPWWLKAIVVVGVPSAIALGLVWSDRVQLANAVFENKAMLTRQVMTDKSHDDKVDARFNELVKQTDETNRILTASCVNSAKTEEQRNRCVGR